MSEAILKNLQKIISELINCDIDALKPEARLIDDLGFESIDFLELSMILGQDYKIEIDEKEMFLINFKSLAKKPDSIAEISAEYPHLPKEEIHNLINNDQKGNPVNISHLIYYLKYH